MELKMSDFRKHDDGACTEYIANDPLGGGTYSFAYENDWKTSSGETTIDYRAMDVYHGNEPLAFIDGGPLTYALDVINAHLHERTEKIAA